MKMNIAILTISSLSLAVSCTTLVIVVIGGLKAQEQVETTKGKIADALHNALDSLEG